MLFIWTITVSYKIIENLFNFFNTLFKLVFFLEEDTVYRNFRKTVKMKLFAFWAVLHKAIKLLKHNPFNFNKLNYELSSNIDYRMIGHFSNI